MVGLLFGCELRITARLCGPVPQMVCSVSRDIYATADQLIPDSRSVLRSEPDDVMEAYLVESRHWSGVAVPRLGGLLSPILRYRSFRTLGLNSPSFFLRGAAVKRLKG